MFYLYDIFSFWLVLSLINVFWEKENNEIEKGRKEGRKGKRKKKEIILFYI